MLPQPDHRLDHRVRRLQLRGHVVLLGQAVHDALMGGRGKVLLGPVMISLSVVSDGSDLFEALIHGRDVGLQLVVEPRLLDGFLQVVFEEQRVENDLRGTGADEDAAVGQTGIDLDLPELLPW